MVGEEKLSDKINEKKMNKEKKQHSLEKKILVNELHAPARRNFKRRHVVVKGYDDLWQADIVEMQPYARANKGHNYILTKLYTYYSSMC